MIRYENILCGIAPLLFFEHEVNSNIFQPDSLFEQKHLMLPANPVRIMIVI
jgi:hypothetical protein